MMKAGRSRAFGIVAVVILVGSGMAVHRKATSGNGEPVQKKMPLVAVAPVRLGSIARTIETSGTVEPENAVSIVPKVEQRIIWMPLKEGDTVRRGQVLARLDSAESIDQLAATQAEVSVAGARLRDVLSGSRPQEIRSAKASLVQAQSIAQQAKRDLEHTKKLYGASGIPEQQRDEAQSKYDTAQANVEAAKATLTDAETELGRQKKMLKIGGVSQEDVDKAQMRSDVAKSALNSANSALRAAKSNLKHVEELNVKVIPEQKLDESESKYASALSSVESAKARLDLLTEGASATQISVAREQVRQASMKAETLRTQAGYCVITSPVSGVITKTYMCEGDLAQTKQPIMSISESGRMIVKAAVTDNEATAMRPGTPAMLQTSTGLPIKLKITRVYPSADSATRLVPIELALPKEAHVSQGSFARINIVTEKRDNCVLVPTDAVMQKPGGKSVVFTVDGGKAFARPIMTGIESNGKVEVLSGLGAGEMLVIKGQEMLRDGVEVKVKPKKGPMGQGKPGMMQLGGSKRKDGGMAR